MAISKLLPAPTNACGQTNYGIPTSSDEHFAVGKIDYQLSASHSLFVRYLGTQFNQASPYAISKNVLSTGTPGASDLEVGRSGRYVSVRGDRGQHVPHRLEPREHRESPETSSASQVGINMYQYSKDYLTVAVTGGFSIGGTGGLMSVYHSASGLMGDTTSW